MPLPAECMCVRNSHDHESLWSEPPESSMGCARVTRLFCGCTSREHSARVWDCSFSHLPGTDSGHASAEFDERRERLAEVMLGIVPPCIGGDVRDWEKGDESETMVHNMVSTSVVHGSEMPINLSQVRCLNFILRMRVSLVDTCLPCTTAHSWPRCCHVAPTTGSVLPPSQ
jgi:hypothetical protein